MLKAVVLKKLGHDIQLSVVTQCHAAYVCSCGVLHPGYVENICGFSYYTGSYT